MSRSHSHGGVVCLHPTKKACDLARHIELGQCSEMIVKKKGQEPYPCDKWAIDRIGERGYCGQHFNSALLTTLEAERAARGRAEVQRNIDRSLAWHATHPSVWDALPDGWEPTVS